MTRTGFRRPLATVLLALSLLLPPVLPPAPAAAATPPGYIDVTTRGVDATGARDSSSALKTILERAAAPRRLYFPPGTYRLANVVLPSRTDVVLDPAASVVPPSGVSPVAFFRVRGSSTSPVYAVSVTGGSFDGKGTTQSGIRIEHGTQVSVSDVSVQGAVTHGIAVISSSSATVKDSRVTGGKWSILVSGTKTATVARNTTDRSGQDGILIYNGSESVNVTGNTVRGWNQERAEGRAGIHAYHAKRVHVTSNLVDGSAALRGEGIRFRDSEIWWASYNTVRDTPGWAINVVRIGDSALRGGNGWITHNTVLRAKGRGISDMSYSTAPRVRIQGNSVTDVKPDGSGEQGYGIVAASAGAAVVGNRVYDSTGIGISLKGASELALANVVSNAALGSSGPQCAIWVSGKRSVVRWNRIRNDQTASMTYGVKVEKTGSARVSDNTISGYSAASVYLTAASTWSTSDPWAPSLSVSLASASGGYTAAVKASDPGSGLAALSYSKVGASARYVTGSSISLPLPSGTSLAVQAFDFSGNKRTRTVTAP